MSPPASPRRRLLPGLGLAAALLLVGCANPSASRISYASVQALNPGVSAAWVLEEYPTTSVTRRADGSIETLTYPVNDPRGMPQTLVLVFDRQGVMREKRYSGVAVRPGGPQGGPKTQ